MLNNGQIFTYMYVQCINFNGAAFKLTLQLHYRAPPPLPRSQQGTIKQQPARIEIEG